MDCFYLLKYYLDSSKKMRNLFKNIDFIPHPLYEVLFISDVHVHVTFDGCKQCHHNAVNDNQNLFICL